MKRLSISVLIHTLNEADQIEECLRSVEWADEILLLDSWSEDGTVEIVRKQFPEVIIEQRESKGSAAQKNYGIDRVSHDWVLVVDADERVTSDLRDEILELLSDTPGYWGYSVPRRNLMLGGELRFGGLQRDRINRFFHRNHARYPNRRVHAELEVHGRVGRLRSPLAHNYVRSLDHMAEKMERYARWAAAQIHIDRRRATPLDIVVHPTWRFIRDYLVYLGFLDGMRGLLLAGMHAWYTFLKYGYAWEYRRMDRRGLPVPLPSLDLEESLWRKPWDSETDPDAEEARTRYASS